MDSFSERVRILLEVHSMYYYTCHNKADRYSDARQHTCPSERLQRKKYRQECLDLIQRSGRKPFDVTGY